MREKLPSPEKKSPIRYSDELAGLVTDALPASEKYSRKIHPATKVFMALRIAVNRELDVLERFMTDLPEFLNGGGRFCVLSYHSLEDRIVKQHLRVFEKGCVCPPNFPQCACGRKPEMRSVSRRIIRPGDAEIAKNPMARSAKLRVAEKLHSEGQD